jgi:hypothetical protein
MGPERGIAREKCGAGNFKFEISDFKGRKNGRDETLGDWAG